MANRGFNSKNGGVIYFCQECKKEIAGYKSKQVKFCSLFCRNKNYAKRKGIQCGFYGKKHSETTKIKIGNNSKKLGLRPPSRINQSPWNKGKEIFYNRGEKNCMKRLELRIQVSERQKGPKAYNWKGGVTPINKRLRNGMKFALWREQVFKRDNYKCRECGSGGRIHPHHILHFAKFPALRFDVNNGITLCPACHQAKHKKIVLSEV